MDALEDRLAELYQRLQMIPNLRNAYDAAYSKEEQQRHADLHGKRPIRKVLDSMLADYAKGQNMGPFEALIELAHLSAMLRPGERERLLSSLRTETSLQATVTDVPAFRDDGSLTFKNRIIGKFQIRKVATRFTRILTAFQQANWRLRIGNPLRGASWQEAHDAIAKLNRQVSVIRFHVHENGRFLSWELRESKS